MDALVHIPDSGCIPDVPRLWTASAALSETAAFADWDAVALMVATLRLYLFEHGTIPVWNVTVCGGRPELSVPYSWAFTWPSVLAYLLPPLTAIIALWAVMSAIGFAATYGLLRRWFGNSFAAFLGAGLYVFSGCFAARFNAGHVTFAFHHLVPLLMFLFEKDRVERLRATPTQTRSVIWSGFVAFLLFSGGLPHAILHFYPAFILLLTLRSIVGATEVGWLRSVAASCPTLVAHVLGIWLASYKLLPVILSQTEVNPAQVLPETYSFADIIKNTLVFVPHYFDSATHYPWHVYPGWGYNAYVGPLAWVLGVLGALAAMRMARRRGLTAEFPAAIFGPGLIIAGFLLSWSNEHEWSFLHLLSDLPVIGALRAINRFQILIVFGLVVTVAAGITWIGDLSRRRRTGLLLESTLFLFVLGPVALQAALLVWNVRADSQERIASGYALPAVQGPPQLLYAKHKGRLLVGHQSSLLAHGYWLANCFGRQQLPRVRKRQAAPWPLTDPPPLPGVSLGSRTTRLCYADGSSDRVIVNLRTPDNATFNAPIQTRSPLSFLRADLPDGCLVIIASPRGMRAGLASSGLAVLMVAVVLAARRRRGLALRRPS